MVNIVAVDSKRMTMLVEPNVPMDKLLETVRSIKLMPPVVMEFPRITVGGGFAGTGGESSSFRQGLFERTITRIKIVLANGGGYLRFQVRTRGPILWIGKQVWNNRCDYLTGNTACRGQRLRSTWIISRLALRQRL